MARILTHGDTVEYSGAVANFRIENALARFSGDFESGLNVCVECCDRHVGGNRLALRAISAEGKLRDYTFEDLRDLSARMANSLTAQGIREGDVVAGLLPRTPELMVTILGALRLGAIYQPLFTAFGPKAIEQRLDTSGAKLVVTNTTNRGKLDDVPNCPLTAVVLKSGEAVRGREIDLAAALATAGTDFEPIMRKGDDLFLMMTTSGTTGAPKGVPVPLRALPAFEAYMREAVDLRSDDVFWNIADPGWAYGLYYAVIGPLLLGVATTFYEGGFTAESTYDIIVRYSVTNFAGSPTAFRLLMAAGAEPAAAVRGRLRVVSSAGEPLNPEVIRWFDTALNVQVFDHYGQTEVGMVVNNHHALSHPFRHGSAGFAMPGFRVAVLDDKGNKLGPRQPGTLSVDIANSPLMWFKGYYGKDTPEIGDGYYRTGDTVEMEEDGSVSFIGRLDDVITSSGYRVGPFDVESALLEHPAVAETAVIGVPDPKRTEIVKAFVVLKKAMTGTPTLAEELAQHVKKRLSAHAYPRAIDFVPELPKTPSGKIQRFVLRKAEIEKLSKN